MSEFAVTLVEWQASHGRNDLPWQQNREPYHVWLSEIMLQQTQVDTVIPYYQRFLQRFPDVAALATAPLDDVLALWSGLGYYARARNLHRAAQMVMDEYGGVFPATAAELIKLPGIGRSTAAAIASFCYGERVAILDGNVKRVLARHFGIEGFPGERAIEQDMWALAETLVPERGVEIYPQAIMDLGATLCTRSKPLCLHCPVTTSCVARREGRQSELPTPKPRKAVPQRESAMLVLRAQNHVLLEQRPASGIWGGLFSLPEMEEGEDAANLMQRRFGLSLKTSASALPPVRHVFTHFVLTIQPWQVDLKKLPAALNEPQLCWIDLDALDKVGLPAPVRRLLQSLE
ncbi:A/G-specific adenine glycosylase [Uliginosibacterium sp. H3]|uniref:Adenine DNA glycosylase n=1 Tax=Uliginosibacterium silvisoli TaxID=3114758 RepID=A0ABU6JZA5_9RHOO|nr:A/G-specific adenine glycosylase [Uliginosibacterium sp. H3]